MAMTHGEYGAMAKEVEDKDKKKKKKKNDYGSGALKRRLQNGGY